MSNEFSRREALKLSRDAEQAEVDTRQALASSAQVVIDRRYENQAFKPTVAEVTEQNGRVVVRDTLGNPYTVVQEDLEIYSRVRDQNLAVFAQDRAELNALKQYWRPEDPVEAIAQDGLYNRLNQYTRLSDAKTNEPRAYEQFRSYVDEYESPTSSIRPPGAPPRVYDRPLDDVLERQSQAAAQAAVNGTNDALANQALTNLARGDQAVPGGTLTTQELERLKFQAINNDAIRQELAANVDAQQSATVQNSNSVTNNDEAVDNQSAFLQGPDESAAETRRIAEAADRLRRAPIRGNPLDEYTSYTYGLTLYVLDKDQANLLVQNVEQFVPNRVLISSAGRTNSTSSYTEQSRFEREPGWEDNFYFDNFKLTQLIAPNNISRTSNTLDIEFTLIEPYGLSLLDRLLRTAARLKQKTYTNLCYLLQIDFYDAEKGLLIDHRKRIPILLKDMNIKVGVRGSEYMITAVPFLHQGFRESYSSTPANFEISASTLRDFFRDDNATDTATINAGLQAQREGARTAQAIATAAGITGARQTDSATAQGQQSDTRTYQINSYVAAFNAYHRRLHELNVQDSDIKPTTIRVRFHDDIIAKEKITQPTNEDGTVGRGPMLRNYIPGTNANPNDTSKNWAISAGTSVAEVINQAMMNSEYIREQVLLASQTEKNDTSSKEGEVRWWKICPSVKINDFDESTQRWSFDITYFVLPYTVYNTRHKHLPKSKVTRTQCVKQYKFIYTGENSGVIDFQVEFDMLYQLIAVGMAEFNVNDPKRNPQGAPETAEQDLPQRDSNKRKVENLSVAPVHTHNITQNNPELIGKGLERDPVSAALAAITDSIYTQSSGDMLTLTLKIVGDPEWIKQDDIYFTPAKFYDENKKNANSDGIVMPPDWNPASTAGAAGVASNNSLIMDAGHILVWVEMRNPVDVDESTGGLRPVSAYGDLSVFTGVYQAMDVVSELTAGKFEQTLTLVRYQEQPQDNEYRSIFEREMAAVARERQLLENPNTAGEMGTTSKDVTISGGDPAADRLTDETVRQLLRDFDTNRENFDSKPPLQYDGPPVDQLPIA